MPEISVQKQCLGLTSLTPNSSFGEPIGPLPAQANNSFYVEGNLATGTWECAPGKLRLNLEVTVILPPLSWSILRFVKED